MSVAIKIENVSKLYRLGTVGTGTISHDLNRWWHTIRGKEDPYALVGQVNDRTKKSGKSTVISHQSSANAATENCQLETDNSRASSPDYVWALKDINLEVAQGEILGIIGRNGAGKSTLLKLLSRVTAPTTGSIKTKGRIASLLEVGTGFHPELTGRENIYMNGAVLGMRRHEITRQLEDIVEFSGCSMYIDTPVKRYSSGMTVRLGFAVAAHLDCEILIVDEVLAVGDAEFQAKAIGKMKQVSQSGDRTILFVSHNMGAIRRLCSTACILENGTFLKLGGLDNVLEYYAELSKPTTTELELTKMPRLGSGAIKFTSVEVNSAETRTAGVACSGDTLTFTLGLAKYTESEIKSVVVSVGLKDSQENFVLLVRSSFDLDHFEISGCDTIQCKINDLALAPGTYNGVLFISERDQETLDLVENAFKLTVIAGRFFLTGSPGLPSHCKTLTRANWHAY